MQDTYTAKNPNTENWKQIFPEKELRCHSLNFHIHVSVSDLYFSTIDQAILLQEICGAILGIYKSLTYTWMWKLVLRPRVQFPETEYINGFSLQCTVLLEVTFTRYTHNPYHMYCILVSSIPKNKVLMSHTVFVRFATILYFNWVISLLSRFKIYNNNLPLNYTTVMLHLFFYWSYYH